MRTFTKACKNFILPITMLLMLVPTQNVYGMAMSGINFVGGAAGIGYTKDGIMVINEISDDEKAADRMKDLDLSGNIIKGVYVDEIDVSGLTYEQAADKINKYVDSINDGEIIINSIDDNKESISVSDIGFTWDDPETIAEALSLGKSGNLIQQYKDRKDVEHDKVVYDLNMSYDKAAVRQIVEQQASIYNVEGEKGSIVKEGDEFVITPGTVERAIDIEASVKSLEMALKEYRGGTLEVSLVVSDNAEGSSEEVLSKVKDVLGSFTTSFSSSGRDRSGNVRNGTSLVNGTLLMPGEQFSMYETVSPFTEENGYFMAGSYLNGMVVESLGGGICQVSSTLYNAVVRAELQVDERYNHSMIVSYVSLSSDAAISGTSKDFKFTNSLEYPIYIEGYTTDDKQVVFNIYGVETRPENRTIEFESVELSSNEAEGEKIVADPSQPFGYVSVQAPHTGYTGEFWKIVKIDGEETERIQLNKSNYLAAPRTATVGTATDNPAALSALQTAIASGSIDFVKSTIAQLNAAASAAAALGGE